MAKVGIPVVCFGPIRDECNFHAADEFVYLEIIDRVKRTMVNLIRNWKPALAERALPRNNDLPA